MKIRAGDLRQLIREELAVEPDPFKAPKQKPDLRSFAKNVLQCEDLLGDMPRVLNQIAESTSNLKAKNMLKKGSGLAYHASNDLKALEAILTIAVKEMQKN